MSAQNDRKRADTRKSRPKGRLLAVIGTTMALSALIGAYGTFLTKPAPTKTTAQPADPVAPETSKNLTDSHSSHGPVQGEVSAQKTPGNSSGASPAAGDLSTLSLSEILVRDDACRLLELLKPSGPASARSAALSNYLLATPFRGRFEEYSELLSGFEATRTSLGTFYLGLAHAHWLENQGWKNPYQKSYGRAARILLQLARMDHGNAAPAAFALLAIEAALIENDESIGISLGEKAEAIELVSAATKFDSYMMGYLAELAAIDDPSAVSLILRTQHLSELAVPNWNEFRLRWSQSQTLKQEDKLKIADLIAANALQAKKPSSHLGYSYLEHRFAQSLAGGARAYQTPEQIDNAFPSSLKSNFETFMKGAKFSNPCGDPNSDPAVLALRAYAKEIKRLDAGFGLSF